MAHVTAHDPSELNLSRLLSRLEHALLSSDADPTLRTSSHERTKVGAVEHDSSGIKIQSRKQVVQADLQKKRELIKALNQRLYELNQVEDSEDGRTESSSEDEEDVPSYAPRRGTSSGLDREQATQLDPSLQSAAQNLHSTLRARKAQSAAPDTATTTATSQNPSLSQTETLLSHNRTEQESLTESLLGMAQALKAQSLQFGASLEGEKEVLSRAGEGLEKNATGMQAASQRMGTLRRMTEGKGWWGRMLMYAWIAGLWLVAFLLVFVAPKLRF